MSQAPIAASGEELDREQVVVRLVITVPGEAFVPVGQPDVIADSFKTSTADKAEAIEKGEPVRLTVWDRRLTTVDQARAIHGRSDTYPAWLKVSDIHEVRRVENAPRLKVVRCPLPATKGPGAEGHCGIEGLDRLPGEQKTKFKSIRDALAARATTRPPED